jgi:hypothetical protein
MHFLYHSRRIFQIFNRIKSLVVECRWIKIWHLVCFGVNRSPVLTTRRELRYVSNDEYQQPMMIPQQISKLGIALRQVVST